MTTTTAPDLTPGYPSKGRKLGPAWVDIWRTLSASEDHVDGRELAEAIAPAHELSPATLVALMSRAAKAGLLTTQKRTVTGSRGDRVRTHYRAARTEG
jgi:hypothetical protein